MTDALTIARSALADAVTASTDANRNIGTSLQAALGALQAIDLTPPPPVLRIVQADFTGGSVANADFQQALDGAGFIYVPAGTFLIDGATRAWLRSRTTVIFHKDAQLRIKPNALDRYYGLFCDADVADVQTIGGSILGDRLGHTYGLGTNEHGMGVGISGGKRIRITELRVEQCTGDGISAFGEDLTFERITSTANRRQGMSLYTGARYRVLGGEYSNTGNMGTNAGTDPRAGVDIEPDKGNVDDVLFDSVTFSGNQTAGLLSWSRSEAAATISRVRAINCDFTANANGIDAKGIGGPIDIAVMRSRFTRNRAAGVKVESGSTFTIGSKDPADANTFVGTTTRTTKTLTGIATKYDIQVSTGGVANVGVNIYG